ncbi:hypothetical protein [Ectopseudomonas mendocina]|uniref:hypothetical protein n=1 Tax=Ectopseudomonas mendocina TaxID=300 RepID=UPI000F705333|nr:hypothetical protein [Pseudomonas mendocina]VEE16354.1 Uncharacterised protein [Pseudomonas mendocina]
MRAAISLRLLLALALMGWGQFGYSATYNFANSTDAVKACQAAERSGTYPGSWCQVHGQQQQAILVSSIGSIIHAYKWSGCPAGQVPTGTGGQCVAPDPEPEPEPDCSTHLDQMKFAAVDCAASPSGAYSTPSVVSIDGGEYVSAPQLGVNQRVKKNLDGSGTGICVARYQGTGKCQAPSEGTPGVPEGAYADATPEGNQPPCFDFGGSELCLSPDNAGCDVYKGNPWCYQTGDTCGEIGGEFVCLPNTSRQCTFVNGKMECISTGNPRGSSPPSVIPGNSSDHPYNGGNADGNDKNDPKAPGTADDTKYVGGGGPPTDMRETNEAIASVGDKVEESKGILQDILDLLSGEGSDDSGDPDGSPADAEAEGAALGNTIADSLTAQMQTVDEERNEEVETVLDQLPNQVGQWFGSDGSAVGLDFMHSILPSPVACADYIVPLTLAGYTANLRLPVCALIPYKPILEWVIWCLTAIGAWRIGYAALRQEDARHRT